MQQRATNDPMDRVVGGRVPGASRADVAERLMQLFEGFVDVAVVNEVLRGVLYEHGVESADDVPVTVQREAERRLERLATALVPAMRPG